MPTPAALPIMQPLQAELHAVLLPLGINTATPERFVVMQQRQAVAVTDPLALVSHMEVGGPIGAGWDHVASNRFGLGSQDAMV